MQVDELLEQLEGVKRTGSGWSARCPSHEDRSPSLSILEGDEGLIITCHAGCDKEAILDSLGLEWRDLFYDDEPEAEYVYTDEQGQPLYRVQRFPGKKFKQGMYDYLANEYRSSMGDVRRVLYHLPEVLYGVEQGKTIYLCEGEKDADALRERGKVATTSVGGAQSWKEEYSQILKGARVVIVQDKDEPGRKRAIQIRDSLFGLAKSCWIVQAAKGKDVYDHLQAGLTVEQLEVVREGDGIVVPIKPVKAFISNLKPYNSELDYLGPLLHGGSRIHLAGPTGHGKTTLMLEMQSAALHGNEFLDWHGKGGLKALHIDLEMPEEALYQAVIDARLDDHDGFHLWHVPDGMAIDTNENHRAMLEKAVQGYDIVTIDPWYKLLEDELNYESAREVIGLLDGLRAQHPRMAMLLGYHAHQPANSNVRVNLSNISGFKKWHWPADIVFTFQRLQGNYSRVVWAKDRLGRLGVGIEEEWILKWSKGYGFTRGSEEELQAVYG